MDLILWRHAEAEDGAPDLARRLTPKGHRQARQVARWLRQSAPEGLHVIASPARRAQETAEALQMRYVTSPALAPGATAASVLQVAGWPQRPDCVVLVGHQPELGRAAALALCQEEREWHIKKGGLWWLAGGKRTFVRAVVSPDLL